jgi:hypothetical protein
MGDFRHRYRGLVEQVSLQDQKRLSTVQVRSALWRIARDHLATLTDPDRYDEVGTLVERQTHSEANTIYVEELYVAPKEGGEIASFLSSGKRGLVLVGDSGAGKSNVLVHHYLERLRSGELAVFLSGRRFETASFGDGLMSKVVGRITDAWTSLDALDNFLEENDDTLVVFLDAVNEYSGPLGARALLESLIAGMAADNMRRVKLVTTIRSETWSQYCAQVGQGRPLDETVFAAKDPVRIEPFQGRELCGRLYATYQAYYALRPATLEDLSSQVQDLVARPFMMGMVAETYSNRALNVDADPRLIPSELDYFSIFARLTERKAQDAQILVHPANVADRENMPEAIGDFCSLLAEMMFERLVSNDPRLTSGPRRSAGRQREQAPRAGVIRAKPARDFSLGGRAADRLARADWQSRNAIVTASSWRAPPSNSSTTSTLSFGSPRPTNARFWAGSMMSDWPTPPAWPH